MTGWTYSHTVFHTWCWAVIAIGITLAEASTAAAQDDAPPAAHEREHEHWAYQQPAWPPIPTTADSRWPNNPIDAFILEQLEARQLQPVGDADRQTLVRRLYYDLTGLPPTPSEIAAFVQDRRADAYERLVERLLASPRFGERWGRHWLDVARFGESVTLRGFVFPQAWRYRDYVIHAFNSDLPYDQFMQEQVAGDLLPATSWQERRGQMVATTFLMLGNTNFEEQDKKQLDMDVVDEQLDTLGKAFLGQTIGCARCHDHKFDPIPTRDYYALAGILRGSTALQHENVSKWIELPLPVAPDQEAALEEHEQQLAELDKRIKQAKQRATQLAAAGTGSADILTATELPGIVVDSAQAKPVGQWKFSQYHKRYVGDGYLHDLDEAKGAKTLTFLPELPRSGQYEVRLAYIHGSGRAARVPITILHANGESVVEVDQQKVPPLEGRFVSLGEFHFERGNQGYVLISNEGTHGYVTADAVQFLSTDAVDSRTDASAAAGDGESTELTREAQQLTGAIKRMEKELKELTERGPRRDKVMTVQESGSFVDLPIHHRGSVHNLGEVAPRGFLEVATYGQPLDVPADESGRRQLAQWLADPANPLPARVMVNRLWYWLFGTGLVRTTDNLGTTGDLPSHPQLLDYLALQLIQQQWSVKELVRQMVLSRTYQLSSVADEKLLVADPENHLYGRMDRRRLDAEAIRDTMLMVSGGISWEMGGQTFPTGTSSDYGYQHTQPCRSVYVPVFRNALPDLFEAFDFPDPSMVSGHRNESIVAPQALFLMNHPFVIEQASATAERALAQPLSNDGERVQLLYRSLLGRRASAEEVEIALDFVQTQTGGDNSMERKETWAQLVQAIFASPDFRFVR